MKVSYESSGRSYPGFSLSADDVDYWEPVDRTTEHCSGAHNNGTVYRRRSKHRTGGVRVENKAHMSCIYEKLTKKMQHPPRKKDIIPV